MKKMGFFGVAEATTLIGDVTLAPSVGFETVSGKSFEPAGGGVAGGAGRLLVLGDQVTGTAGVEGYEGCEGDGVLGVVGVVGVVGVEVVLDMLLEVPLQPASERLTASAAPTPNAVRAFRKAGNEKDIYHLRQFNWLTWKTRKRQETGLPKRSSF